MAHASFAIGTLVALWGSFAAVNTCTYSNLHQGHVQVSRSTRCQAIAVVIVLEYYPLNLLTVREAKKWKGM